MGRGPAKLRVQETEKILNLWALNQPDLDQSGGIDRDALGVRDYRGVILRGTEYTFDTATIKHKPFEADPPQLRFGHLQKHLKCARDMDHRSGLGRHIRVSTFPGSVCPASLITRRAI